MRTYVVGGAVRDELLGLPVRDRDWVVIGATPQDMLAAGFRPVGKDFPVFLHPDTNEEYALARTERKSGRGYKGFTFHTSPDVTLEQDLLRRDLTINAMARDADGNIVDPFDGRADLAAHRLRHVSPSFAEDPLRVLRVARFAARFGQFEVAPETMALMRKLVEAGEIEHLVPERAWQEIARGLSEAHPKRMLGVLHECGALARLLPEITPPPPAALDALQRSAARNAPLESRWACLLHRLGADTARNVSERLRAPNEARDLAVLLAREGHALLQSRAEAGTMFDLIARCDALRRPERFAALLDAAHDCDRGVHRSAWIAALAAAQAVDAGAIAKTCPDKGEIAERVRSARVAAIAALDAP